MNFKVLSNNSIKIYLRNFNISVLILTIIYKITKLILKRICSTNFRFFFICSRTYWSLITLSSSTVGLFRIRLLFLRVITLPILLRRGVISLYDFIGRRLRISLSFMRIKVRNFLLLFLFFFAILVEFLCGNQSICKTLTSIN